MFNVRETDQKFTRKTLRYYQRKHINVKELFEENIREINYFKSLSSDSEKELFIEIQQIKIYPMLHLVIICL